MRRLSALLSALLLSACATSAQIATAPIAGTIAPEAGTLDPERCADLRPLALEWSAKLRMGDWQIVILCQDIPDSENAWALSYVDAIRRQTLVKVDPDAPDHELTVLHELTHGVLTHVREADSELVEEQEARTLSELMLCRDKVGDQ